MSMDLLSWSAIEEQHDQILRRTFCDFGIGDQHYFLLLLLSPCRGITD